MGLSARSNAGVVGCDITDGVDGVEGGARGTRKPPLPPGVQEANPEDSAVKAIWERPSTSWAVWVRGYSDNNNRWHEM